MTGTTPARIVAGLAIGAAAVTLFYSRVGGYRRATGFLCPTPGGLTEMVELGAEKGARASELREAGLLCLGATLLALTIGLGFAAVLRWATGLPRDQVLLAYAPGGLTEMSLVAVAIEADIAFATLHHLVRLLLILAVAPLAFKLFADPGAAPAASGEGAAPDAP